jgi:surface antigen
MQVVPANGAAIALAIAAILASPSVRANGWLDNPRPIVTRPITTAPFNWMQGPLRNSGLPVVQRPTPMILPGAGGRTLASYRAAVPTIAVPQVYQMPVAPMFGQVPNGVAGDLSCVPFARIASGIDLKGDALTWWDKAAGTYSRGSRPEVGSVLAFRATEGMPLGHVAVVSRQLSSRLITVDHANWAGSRNSVARAVPVMDVSPNNDWTQVRLTVASTGDFGSTYPTSGFIYRRPDTGAVFVNR